MHRETEGGREGGRERERERQGERERGREGKRGREGDGWMDGGREGQVLTSFVQAGKSTGKVLYKID